MIGGAFSKNLFRKRLANLGRCFRKWLSYREMVRVLMKRTEIIVTINGVDLICGRGVRIGITHPTTFQVVLHADPLWTFSLFLLKFNVMFCHHT